MTTLTLRLDDTLHEVARVAAASRGLSLNAFLVAAIRAHVLQLGSRDKIVAAALDREARTL